MVANRVVEAQEGMGDGEVDVLRFEVGGARRRSGDYPRSGVGKIGLLPGHRSIDGSSGAYCDDPTDSYQKSCWRYPGFLA